MTTSLIKSLKAKQVTEMVGISLSTLYDWLDETSSRYDPTFPKQFKLRQGGKAVRWFLHDIETWLKNRQAMSQDSNTQNLK